MTASISVAKSIRITLSLNEASKRTLVSLADERHQTRSQVVRDALEHYKLALMSAPELD